MKIQRCLIITDDDSLIELAPHEQQEFCGNQIVHKSRLNSGVLEKWRAPVMPLLTDANSAGPKLGRSPMDNKIPVSGFRNKAPVAAV